MTPEGIERMMRTPLGRKILQAMREHEVVVALLRFDIKWILAAGHQEDFDEGWPHHHRMKFVPYWPDERQWWN